jgi:hypothetical protein
MHRATANVKSSQLWARRYRRDVFDQMEVMAAA